MEGERKKQREKKERWREMKKGQGDIEGEIDRYGWMEKETGKHVDTQGDRDNA